MAKFPALMLWTDAWIADTHHLSRLERGTYFDLLVLMWRTSNCRVPNDNCWLGKRLGMTPAEVQSELRPIISEFCQSDGNYLFQKRLRKEFTVTQKKSSEQSVRAKTMWEKKKKSSETYAEKHGAAYAPRTTSIEERKKEEDTASAVSSLYVFESGVIRLNKKDFDQWKEAFSHLDLRAELLSLTEWAGQQPKWFFAVSGALAKRNREIKAGAGSGNSQQSRQKVNGITAALDGGDEVREGTARLLSFGRG